MKGLGLRPSLSQFPRFWAQVLSVGSPDGRCEEAGLQQMGRPADNTGRYGD